MTMYGWDASAHDWERHPVSLANAKSAGIALMTHKATEGHTFTDPRFDDFIKQDPAQFPVAGSYCAAWPNDSQQADHWFTVVNQVYPKWKDHPCWIWQIDAEPWAHAPRTINLSEIKSLGARIQKLSGCDARRIVVYAPKWEYGNTLQGLPYHLWSSSYGDNPAESFKTAYPGDNGSGWVEYSGQKPIIWQYGSRTTIGNQPTCDANAIRVNSVEELQALFGGGDDMTPAEAKEAMLEVLQSSDGKKAIYEAVLEYDGFPNPSGANEDTNPAWMLQSVLYYMYRNGQLAATSKVSPEEVAKAVIAALPPASTGGITQEQVQAAVESAINGATIQTGGAA